MKRILAVDGGGMHGIKPAVWCQMIEGAAQKPCSEIFDLIAGTSTGSVLAGALGLNMQTPKITQLYLDEAPKIFRNPRDFLATLRSPKYRGKYLRERLDVYYRTGPNNRQAKMRDAKTNLMMTAYMFEKRGRGGSRPAFFKSWMPHEKDMLILDAVQASSVAPTAHPMHAIVKKTGETDYYTDGGVFANNPGICALVDALALFPGAGVTEDLVMVSLGTGQKPTDDRAKTHGGLVWWAQKIVPVFLEGMNTVAHYQAQVLEKSLPKFKYIRLEVETPGKKADETREIVLKREANKAAREGQSNIEFQDFLRSL